MSLPNHSCVSCPALQAGQSVKVVEYVFVGFPASHLAKRHAFRGCLEKQSTHMRAETDEAKTDMNPVM